MSGVVRVESSSRIIILILVSFRLSSIYQRHICAQSYLLYSILLYVANGLPFGVLRVRYNGMAYRHRALLPDPS